MTPSELRESAPVRRWLERSGYADRGEAEQEQLLEELAGFCDFAAASPDTLVASCLRSTAAGTAISTKGRRRMQETIDAWVEARGLTGHESIVAGNRIRGFLVHNGVFIQGRASIH